MVDNSFKIIVVGGGPVGLIAAHILSKAGISYVVLESRASTVIDVGASLVIWPQGLRILAQLGVLEQLRHAGAELNRVTNVTAEGHKYKEIWAPLTLKKKLVILTIISLLSKLIQYS